MRIPALSDRLAARERPAGFAAGRQRWSDLLFLHWRLEPGAVQAKLPTGLKVDVHDGAAWLGIVPFFMERIRPVFLPPLPWLSWFLELNVRTYVHDREGRPGVYFFSLDCNQPVAVSLARKCFHLNYQRATMHARREGNGIRYGCRRRRDAVEACYAWQRPDSLHEAEPGSLEFFLLERYALYAAKADGSLVCGRVHHAPYRVAEARVQDWSVRPAELAGFPLSGPPDSVLASPGVEVLVYAVKALQAPGC